MTKKKWDEPELMADDHHGQYMMQLLCKDILPIYQNQIIRKIGKDGWQAIMDGPDNEIHFEVCDEITNIELKTQTGQKFSLQYAEGGIWAIPACFMRTKKANDFFEC